MVYTITNMYKAPTACSSLIGQKKGGNSGPKELKNLNVEKVQNTGVYIREYYFFLLYKNSKGREQC